MTSGGDIGLTEAAPISAARASAAPISIPRITRLTSDALGMVVNLYLVEGRDGVVVIDGAISRRFAAHVRDAITATGKPLLGAILTHGHPDHFCGLGEILAGQEVPIFALPGAIAQLGRRWDEAVPGMRAAFGDDFPQTLRKPDTPVADGDTVALGDLRFAVRAYGAGESECDATWTLLAEPGTTSGDTVFCGDLVYNNMHVFMQDGHAEEWLDALARLSRAHAPGTRFHPGHGPAGGHELIQWTAGYIRMYLRAMRDALDLDPGFGPGAEIRLVETIRSYLPSDDLIDLAQFRLDITAHNLARVARDAKEIY
jgi:glyoxylase-like metal-dependent hydrolase (beta-lactamase superfamily II)